MSTQPDLSTEKKDGDSNDEKRQDNRDTPVETGTQEFER